MMHVARPATADAKRRPGPRLVHPIGTAVRAIAGLALVVVAVTGSGLTGWDALGALVVLPLIAVALDRLLDIAIPEVATVTGRLRSETGRTWASHISALVLIVAIATTLTFVTPIDAGAIWLFFGVSFVVVAIRGDAGCEALAVPNAIFGRRDEVGCVALALIDSLEAR